MNAPRLLTGKEAAQLLTVCSMHVRRLVRRGELPYVMIGKARRYREADLLAYIERQTITIGKTEGGTDAA